MLALRRGKGMVLDPDDPDSVSRGLVLHQPDPRRGGVRGDRGARRGRAAALPEPDGRVKTRAAWLIERAGFHKGDTRGSVGISTKHSLALINRGGATTAELVAFAREIADGVRERFGVELHPEPIFVGHDCVTEVLYYAVPFFVLLLIVEGISFGHIEDDHLVGFERSDTRTSLTMGMGNGNRLTWVALFFADDLAYYWFHRVSHENRVFWASHVVHHSSRHYNLSTALRQTWVPMTYLPFWLPLLLVGFGRGWCCWRSPGA